jgi:hypothetical protein
MFDAIFSIFLKTNAIALTEYFLTMKFKRTTKEQQLYSVSLAVAYTKRYIYMRQAHVIKYLRYGKTMKKPKRSVLSVLPKR